MKTYIGTKIIQAEPKDRDGAPGYMVRYPDGYESWSPAGAFEGAYRVTDAMTFGDAVHMLKLGKRVARAGWNGKGMWLTLQTPDAGSKMTLPYIFLSYPDDPRTLTLGARVPWLASQTDVLASDWLLLDSAA